MKDYPNLTRVIKEKAADPKWVTPIGTGLLFTIGGGLTSGIFWGGLVAGGMWAYRKFKR
jgi:hypothetical protein